MSEFIVPDVTGMDTLTAGLAYAAHGWYQAPVEYGKHPGSVLGNGWQHNTSRDPEQIVAWHAGRSLGIALHNGRSGAVSFDVDHPENIPAILAQSIAALRPPYQSSRPDEPGRGHYVFAQPLGRDIGNSTGQLGKGWGEIRGRNGVIIAQPSVHAHGGLYQWQVTGAIPVLPDELAALLPDGSPDLGAATDAEVTRFAAEHIENSRPNALNGIITSYRDKTGRGASRHETAVSCTVWAAKEARAGYYSATVAFTAIGELFRQSLNGDTSRNPADEYASITAYAVRQATAADLSEVRDIAERADTHRLQIHLPADAGEVAGGQHRKVAAAEPIPPVSLTAAIDVFRRWLHLTDIAPLLATAAALVANKAEGDPVWLLLVGAPSTGKTELLSASAGLPWIHPAARVTEASLLSGTSAKERARTATGGLLRQVGDFGVLLCKDFTSVLAQNKDSSAEALAALREVYDGSWDRPVGTDGGRVLHWSGKCGLVGGVTPALDRYQQILSALGDRFLLLRLADADQQESGKMALTHRGLEKTMRGEMAAALCGLVDSADAARINDPLTPEDEQRLIDLASFTARGRTAVMRDGYTRELLYLPQVEGPGRLVTAFARMLGALRAIGCDDPAAWTVLHRIAVSCMTAARAAFTRELAARAAPVKTSVLCVAAGMTAKHAREHLEDLVLLGLAGRGKTSDAVNAHDTWEATEALRELWPEVVPINPPHPQGQLKETDARSSPGNGPLGPSLYFGSTLHAVAEPCEDRQNHHQHPQDGQLAAEDPDDPDDENRIAGWRDWPAGSIGEEANQ